MALKKFNTSSPLPAKAVGLPTVEVPSKNQLAYQQACAKHEEVLKNATTPSPIPAQASPPAEAIKYPMLEAFASWLDANPQPDWDYATWAPYNALTRFNPRAFKFLCPNPQMRLLVQRDSQVSTFLGLPEKLRFWLFNAQPPTTTQYEFGRISHETARGLHEAEAGQDD